MSIPMELGTEDFWMSDQIFQSLSFLALKPVARDWGNPFGW